jgi:hypothetical protein
VCDTLVGFDEIHGFRDWNLLEALQPDPHRKDAQTWITSYDTVYNSPGVPLHDLKAIGIAGSDPRMLFTWYSGELCRGNELTAKEAQAIRHSLPGGRAEA